MNSNNRGSYGSHLEKLALIMLWLVIWLTIVYLTLVFFWTIDKIDKIYSILDTNSTCEDN